VIRSIALDTGTITTVVGTGQRGDGPEPNPNQCALSRPHGVFVGRDGALYVSIGAQVCPPVLPPPQFSTPNDSHKAGRGVKLAGAVTRSCKSSPLARLPSGAEKPRLIFFLQRVARGIGRIERCMR
jgi:hypothetical protein